MRSTEVENPDVIDQRGMRVGPEPLFPLRQVNEILREVDQASEQRRRWDLLQVAALSTLAGFLVGKLVSS